MSIQKITTEDAGALMTRYYDEINQMIIEESHDSINDLFMWFDENGETQKLQAFKAPLIDFALFDSFVGLTKIVFSFGLEEEGFANQVSRPRFSLLLKVQNDDGSIQSDYYQLTEAVPMATTLEQGTEDAHSLSVPSQLYSIWTKGWTKEDKTANLCTIELNSWGTKQRVPLKKYVFNVLDAIKTLYIPDRAVKDLTVFISLVNHCSAELDGDNNIKILSESGKIGLILGIAEADDMDSNKFKFVSSCYDFSAPCPPTCP